MYASAVPRTPALPSARASAVTALLLSECERDTPGLALPRPEVHLVVRFGPSAQSGLDVHALGARQRVRRKLIRGGQRVVMARLELAVTEAVLGVPASALAERIVALDDLWDGPATRRLFARLAEANDTRQAATILEAAIAERSTLAGLRSPRTRLVREAANRLASTSVNAVALDLGVSERHLRRVFRETIGLGPKTFTKLARFRRAVGAAGSAGPANWAAIATSAGYYDQAHLIAEFREIAGVTPRALLGELRATQAIG